MGLAIKILGSAILLAISFSSFAQNRDSIAIRQYYEAHAIYYWGSSKYFKNNLSYPLKNLKEEYKFSNDATWELKQFKKSRNELLVGIVVAEGLLVAAILVKDRNLKYGLLGGSVVAIGLCIPISRKMTQSIFRSVWYYNRDILLR